VTRPGKPSKSEWVLLGITGVFLCLVLALFWQDRAAAGPGMTVQAQTQVPQEALTPDLSPIDLNTAGVEELDQLPGIGGAGGADRGLSGGKRPLHGRGGAAGGQRHRRGQAGGAGGLGHRGTAAGEWRRNNDSEGVTHGEDLSGGR
jgi:hypothetical protein